MFNFSKRQKEALIKKVQKKVDEAMKEGERPYAALLIDKKGNVIESAINTSFRDYNVSSHAEMNILHKMAKRKKRILDEYGIVANYNSCPMCMSALIKAEVKYYLFGAKSRKGASPDIAPQEVAKCSTQKIKIESGVRAKECEKQVRAVL